MLQLDGFCHILLKANNPLQSHLTLGLQESLRKEISCFVQSIPHDSC